MAKPMAAPTTSPVANPEPESLLVISILLLSERFIYKSNPLPHALDEGQGLNHGFGYFITGAGRDTFYCFYRYFQRLHYSFGLTVAYVRQNSDENEHANCYYSGYGDNQVANPLDAHWHTSV
jgi:hypothetical protein